MECPYCELELDWEDGYGNRDYIIFGDTDGKGGDIYKYHNEKCESSVFNNMFYTLGNNDELLEGYPC